MAPAWPRRSPDRPDRSRGVRGDRWKYLEPHDGAQHTFDLNLSEKRHVYFFVSSAYGAPSYISEFRVNGD
jgi:hypothetical protein